MVHRNNYRHWTQEVCSPAKIEILRPNLDWRIIWIETTALPNHIGESMFLFNKRLLLTKTRCHRLDRDRNCPLCQQEPETDEHLMTYCQLRHQLESWLEGTVRQLGCRAIPDEIIRGNIGPTENLRTIFTLVAAYIFTTWKERCYQRNPTEVEVKPKTKSFPSSFWTQLFLYKNVLFLCFFVRRFQSLPPSISLYFFVCSPCSFIYLFSRRLPTLCTFVLYFGFVLFLSIFCLHPTELKCKNS